MDKLEKLRDDIRTVRNSLAFVIPSLPKKQKSAIQAVHDELSQAIANSL